MMKRRQNPKRGTHFEEYVLIKLLLGQCVTNAVLFSFVSFPLARLPATLHPAFAP